jgi:predicted RNA-binding Zn ribbon-like protein
VTNAAIIGRPEAIQTALSGKVTARNTTDTEDHLNHIAPTLAATWFGDTSPKTRGAANHRTAAKTAALGMLTACAVATIVAKRERLCAPVARETIA